MEQFVDEVLAGEPRSVFLVVAWYFLLASSVSFFYCLRIRNWPNVTGVLTQRGMATWGSASLKSDQNYIADVAYAYMVDGVRYEGTRLSPFQVVVSHNVRAGLKLQMRGIEYLKPDQVRVFYNPKRPEKSFLIKPGTFGLLFVAAFGLVPFSLYFFAGN